MSMNPPQFTWCRRNTTSHNHGTKGNRILLSMSEYTVTLNDGNHHRGEPPGVHFRVNNPRFRPLGWSCWREHSRPNRGPR